MVEFDQHIGSRKYVSQHVFKKKGDYRDRLLINNNYFVWFPVQYYAITSKHFYDSP